MLKDRAKKALTKKARKGFSGYPLATVAFYGPTDRIATKLVVAIIEYEEAEPEPMRKWFSDNDLRDDSSVLDEVLSFVREHGAKSVVMPDRIMGCPHEEGLIIPRVRVVPGARSGQGGIAGLAFPVIESAVGQRVARGQTLLLFRKFSERIRRD